MAEIKTKYGASGQTVTVTLGSLANAALRQSVAVDNGTNQFLDALVSVSITSAGSGVSTSGYVSVYAYGTADGGTTYTGGASGSDATYTAEKTNLRYLGRVAVVANSTTYVGTFTVAPMFGSNLPQKWGIVVENVTGAALSAGSVAYQGILAEAV